MLYINKITDDPQQNMTLNGIPGISIGLTLRFMPRIQRWAAGVTYNGISYNGIAVVSSPNLLRPWKNILPFGLMCIRADGLDPYTIEDFQTQISNLYLLDATDVAALESGLFA
jgi:hypothetical protein